MLVTTVVGDFTRGLQVGDVVAFDSLSNASAIIQWADRAPVNHVGIVVDRTHLVMANRPEQESDSVIGRPRIWRLLNRPTIRGAVALRHPDLADPRRRKDLLRRVDYYRENAPHFGIADLGFLAPAAYLRSYVSVPGHPGPRGPVRAGFLRALRSLASFTAGAVPGDVRSLVCSEFVYRCFVESGTHVSISHPLDGPGLDEPSVAREVRLLWGKARRRLHGQPQPGPLPSPEPVPHHLGVVPDFVTPGDLWRSSSFTPVAMLVKPPMREWPPPEHVDPHHEPTAHPPA